MGEEIFKARNDDRDYKSLLLSNELRVLLVSDPQADKAAASMDVKVGSFSDPDDLPGLAHFLEHMVFFSSEKYPLEEDFSKFLVAHGGSANAYTGDENTNFHFDVNFEHLGQALDRFAQFFIHPLMSKDAVQREINAVDSENSLQQSTDACRLYQITVRISSRDHPLHKFGTGSLDTLLNRPREKGIDTRERVIRFYEKYYSSNLMCLAVYGKESLPELERMVKEVFTPVENRSLQAPCFRGEPCHPEHLQIMVKAVPIKTRHLLNLQWPVIPELRYYNASPLRYIVWFLGHESDGSILALLKRLGWASSLSADSRGSLDYSFFNIQIELTDLGNDQVESIIAIVFSYIKLVLEKGITHEYFEEIRICSEMNFHYQDKYAPYSYTVSLAEKMQVFPVEHWVVGAAFPREFNPDLIRRELELLTPERVRVFHSSKAFEGLTTETEPWYGAQYSLEKVPENLLKKWRESVDERLQLPQKNPYIPTNFDVLSLLSSKLEHPVLLKQSKMTKLWFKPDHTFKTPKAYVAMNLKCPNAVCSLEANTLSALFTRLLLDELNQSAYYAELGGLWYSVSLGYTGFQVRAGGYNHKLSDFFRKIIATMVSFQSKEDRFHVIKEEFVRDNENHCLQSTMSQAYYYWQLLLSNVGSLSTDYIDAVSSIYPDDMQNYVPKTLSRVSGEFYITGNLTSSEAQDLAKILDTEISNAASLKPKPLLSSEVTELRCVKLEEHADVCYPIAALNPDDENSALLIYFEIAQEEPRLNAVISLFVNLTSKDAFHQLRTVEQLGYAVSLHSRANWGVMGVQISIQSKLKDPRFMETRAEAFLEVVETKLKNLTDDEFKENVNALVALALEKHKNLWEEAGFFWSEISSGTFKFNRREDDVIALRSLTKKDVLDFYLGYIKLGAPKRKKLCVQVFGKLHQAELDQAVKAPGRIDNIFQFRQSQALYPALGSQSKEIHP